MENLSLIAVLGLRHEIGLDNKLLWKIKEDLDFYKSMTLGKNIIMGRKTFESLPDCSLKERNPIVLSTKPLDLYCDVISYNDLQKLVNNIKLSSEDFVVIGGSSIYREFLPLADTMYLTEVEKCTRADAFFPYFNEEEWNRELIGDFTNSEIPYTRSKYVRKKVK